VGRKVIRQEICGEAVTSAPRLHASGVLFNVGGYAVSCTASTMYASETKARRINIFLFVHELQSEVSFSDVLLSETHMLITDPFGLLGKKQVRGGTSCKAVSLLHSRLLAHQPGRSTHVKPRTGMAPMTVSEMRPLSGASSSDGVTKVKPGTCLPERALLFEDWR
jgi:hypothetical protein